MDFGLTYPNCFCKCVSISILPRILHQISSERIHKFFWSLCGCSHDLFWQLNCDELARLLQLMDGVFQLFSVLFNGLMKPLQ